MSVENIHSTPERTDIVIQQSAIFYISAVQNFYTEKFMLGGFANPRELADSVEQSNKIWNTKTPQDVRGYIKIKFLSLQISGIIGEETWNMTFNPDFETPFQASQNAKITVATSEIKPENPQNSLRYPSPEQATGQTLPPKSE